MDGLLVDGRGGDSAGGEDAVDGFLRNGLRGEGAAGVAGDGIKGRKLTHNSWHSSYILWYHRGSEIVFPFLIVLVITQLVIISMK